MIGPADVHSIFDLIKSFIVLVTNNNFSPGIIFNFIKIYTICVFIIFIIISTYLILYEKSNWRTVYLLLSAMILFPFSSHDYTLIHLFIPMFMFIKCDENNDELDYIYSILFAVTLCQLSWLSLIQNFNWYLGIFIRPLMIITTVSIIITQGLRNTENLNFKSRLIKYINNKIA